MDFEQRQEYVDEIQKDITSQCFQFCFKNTTGQLNQMCFKNCYNKYLKTIDRVFIQVKEIGHDANSILALQAFPENNPFHKAYFENKLKQLSPSGIPYSKDVFNERVA